MTLKLNLDLAKRYVSEQVVRQILNYLEGNPDQNIVRMFKMIEALPVKISGGFKKVPHDMRMSYEQNPVYRTYFNSIFTDLDRNVRNRLVSNFLVNTMILSQARRDQVEAKEKIIVPMTFLIDPTSACNLKCTGCWAGAYAKHDELEPELMDRILNEAKELGIYSIVMSGGEPFLYPHYTNGTRIDDAMADRLREVGNIAPAVSLEGWEEQTDARRGKGVFNQVTAAMRRLRERGIFFGASLTITSQNLELITSDPFIDFLIDQGVKFLWSFHYIPVGRQPNLGLMIRPEQRAYLAERIPHLRKNKSLPIADFWNDGELTSGCIAGGRSYFHINARGDVEPCAFAHFAVDNIRDKSLLEVLHSPFFAEYQKRQYFSDNKLRPCPIIDNPQVLRKIVQTSGAHATDDGAETLLNGEIGAFLDHNAVNWKQVSDPIWDERQKNKPAADAQQVAV